MNNYKYLELNISIHKYINKSSSIDKIQNYKKEDSIDIDDNFKKKLKQHFIDLALIHKNNTIKLDI